MKSVVIRDSYDKWKPINPYHNPIFSLLDLHYVIKLFVNLEIEPWISLKLWIIVKMQNKTMPNEYNGRGNSFGISPEIYPYYGIPKGYLKPM